jgi:endonuclease/exonuclease/phosphatase family metal-dependent hydrolase
VTPATVRFCTYNLLAAFASDSAEARERYRLLVETVRGLDPDVLAVQEICAPDEPTARQRLRQFAADTGLDCLAPGPGGEPVPALGFGAHGYHLGLLWRPGIVPVPGSYRSRSQDLWHALAWLTLDVGGARVRHAVYHAAPFGTMLRTFHNEVVVAVLARAAARPPTLVGGDWNCESADRVPGRWRQRRYEPRDPFAGAQWFGELVHQCGWRYDRRGRRRHWADRAAGEVLWAGGLHDAAAVLQAPWQPTAGHHPSDGYGVRGIRRRIDAVRVTPEVIPALRAHWVTDTEAARQASDHLPVTVEYAPAAIAGPAGS